MELSIICKVETRCPKDESENSFMKIRLTFKFTLHYIQHIFYRF